MAVNDYPVFLKLQDRLVLVVGGGEVALRKARGLLDTGCRLRVIAPDLVPEFVAMAQANAQVELVTRNYVPGDLGGATLVFAATNMRQVNAAVANEASQHGVPVCVVDRQDDGDFSVPAVVRRGSLSLAISTGGASPAVARLIRETLEQTFGPEYEALLDLAAEFRDRARTNIHDASARRHFLLRLADSQLLQTVRTAGKEAARASLEHWYNEAIAGETAGNQSN